MQKIMCTGIQPCPSGFGEYQWAESFELDDGAEALAQGLELLDIVENIIENAQIQDEYTATENDIWGTIHNVQPDAVFIQNESGEPVEMYWVEDSSEDIAG